MTDVFYAFDHILMSKGYDDPTPHRHIAKHLIFSLDEPFECIMEKTSFHCKGICINSNIEHTIKSSSDGVFIFLFDETSTLARELNEKYLKGTPFYIIDEELSDVVQQKWILNYQDAVKLDESILSVCNLKKCSSKRYENRICKLLETVYKLEGIYGDTISMLCNVVCLSQSRLSHLFKEQVGVSLRSYLLFEKMRKTYAYVVSGESITSACIRAGFDSSSHFSATCKKMFGISFTNFSKGAVFKEIT